MTTDRFSRKLHEKVSAPDRWEGYLQGTTSHLQVYYGISMYRAKHLKIAAVDKIAPDGAAAWSWSPGGWRTSGGCENLTYLTKC